MKSSSILILIGLFAVAGCGRGNVAVSNDLKTLGLMYHDYNDRFKSGPANADDLGKVLGATGAPDQEKSAIQKLKSGQYVFQWNVSLLQAIRKGSTGDQMLAWESDAPTKGGEVLMVDASVRHMTPQEFQAAKKAGE